MAGSGFVRGNIVRASERFYWTAASCINPVERLGCEFFQNDSNGIVRRSLHAVALPT